MTVQLVFFLLQIFWLIMPAVSASPGNETDKLSLLEFKAKIEEDPLGLLSSWNESVHFCSWPGVACSRRHHQRVAKLELPSWGLKGQLSPHVGNLSFLRTLNLSSNNFTLGIPPEVGRLFRLRVLSLRNNSFSGGIPGNISGLSSLWLLNLFSNRLAGRIPEEIGSLPELRAVVLSYNNLVGEIPASIGNLSSLLYLYLGRNTLQGKIPHSLGQLKNLQELGLGDNNLTGTIPLSLYNISTIKYYVVTNNKLEGNLPLNIGHMLQNLQSFFFGQNNFSGSIPPTISNASNLVNFQITRNNFIGKVPSFAKSSKLQSLLMFYNNLGYADNGDLDFLRDLSNCTNLNILGFGYNNLGGEIPETISNLTRLQRLGIGNNKIRGNIPNGIGNLVNLWILGMEDNHLTGSIPNTIGKLRSLNFLSLENNDISGAIPRTLRNLTLLSKLYLLQNNLQGSVPPSLGECSNLQDLSLAENNLSGPIPPEVLSLPSLSIGLDLTKNQLTGSIPIEVGKLANLGYFDVSENKLSGEIPKTLGSCISMEYLYLEGNFLEGSIPVELESLKGVQEIDLSRNKLSGKIPNYFSDFRALAYLNLSFNDFEGKVSQQGVFKNLSRFSVMGNTRLCGGLPELKLRSCPSKVNEKHELSPKSKLTIIVACAVVGLMIFLFLAILAFRSWKRSKPILELASVGISLPRVSYGDLSKATDGFSSENLIGSGSFGSVYRGTLNQDDTLVAVKVLNLQVSRALKSFLAECESLRIIKHRNLVKFLTVCSSTDFQGNDFKALVYEFMENGNLEEWLHFSRIRTTAQGPISQSRSLNLIKRVNIAGDVASALDYLHNHCPESIAHCDIKPSNILLDGDMVAHVGDFGLAKLLRSAFSTSSSNQSSSVGVRGTVGYVAPEYAMGSEVSTLGDIYSYGILLLEMFTGKRPIDSMFKDDFSLSNFASMSLPERVSEIVDPMLIEEELGRTEGDIRGWDDLSQVVRKSLVSIIEIGVACCSKFPGERRNIRDVVAELGRIRDMLNADRMPRNRVRNAL